MSLLFPYRLISSAAQPGGYRKARLKPLIEVGIVGPTDSRCRLAILDTASDDTVFHESLAEKLGIDLRYAVGAFQRGIGGHTYAIRYASVELRMSDGTRQAIWTATVAFTPAKTRFALLGMSGCLEYFTATFFGDRQCVELLPNSLFPGQITP